MHLIKLAVGIRDLDHLAEVQAERAEQNPPLRHRTRNFPRRRDEVLEGGSLYWVVAGSLSVRQRVRDIREDSWDDGTPCTAFILDPVLVPVIPRAMRPFQGWRYLARPDAPADLATLVDIPGAAALPAELRRELRALCLL